MSEHREPGFLQRVDERPSLRPQKIAKVAPRELGIRFVAGAVTSVVAGALALGLGARVGGIMLAFPSILAASLTLVEQKESDRAAREDARGAALGGLALAAFAATGALAFGAMSGALALVLATGIWLFVAFGAYRVLWLR